MASGMKMIAEGMLKARMTTSTAIEMIMRVPPEI
jgi:hypothetical protein